ncbi:hypothetical protein DHEL01_v208115 [Diaporthe helianthi]|uniref:Uncharacterized protein n=1 Tax=Diaporthe helianthi TaxID=158607 RepID=A0A2P5HTC0_DIAHE|nr:hypothetical protein DHEL01_v208115 [Diaporthe helianthi]
MVAHLRNVHKMDLAQAQELVQRKARMETVVPERAILGPRPSGTNNGSNANKRGYQQQASLAAPGKENHPPPPTTTAALDGVREQSGARGITGAEPKLKKPRVNKS